MSRSSTAPCLQRKRLTLRHRNSPQFLRWGRTPKNTLGSGRLRACHRDKREHEPGPRLFCFIYKGARFPRRPLCLEAVEEKTQIPKPSDTPCTRGKSGPAARVYKAWQQDRAEQWPQARLTKGPSASAFNVGYDRNNGRPRYCHVRLKPAHVRVEHAPLRLAVVNS